MQTLNFNKEIYDPRVFEQIHELYSEFATIVKKDSETYTILEISNIDNEFKDVLGLEIMNYAFVNSFELKR